MSRVGGWVGNLALLLVSAGLGLGVLELGLRAMGGNWHPTSLFVQVPDRIATVRPGIDTVVTSNAGGTLRHIHIRTDAQGFRDEGEVDASRPHIVVYGDSNVFARFAPMEETFGARLEADLGGRYQVLNAGVIGYGPDQSLLRLEADYDRVRPRLVVFQIFVDNDFGDLVRDGLFRLDGERLVQVQRPPGDPAFSFWERMKAGFFLARAADSVGQKLGLVPPDPEIRSPAQGLAQCREEYEVYRAGGFGSWLDDHYDFDLAMAPDSPSAVAKTALMRAVLRRVQDFAKAKGVPILFLLEPSSIDMTENEPLNHRTIEAVAPGYAPERVYDGLLHYLQDQGATVVGLWQPFAAAGAADMYFRVNDDHWSPAGMAVAATATAEAIRRME